MSESIVPIYANVHSMRQDSYSFEHYVHPHMNFEIQFSTDSQLRERLDRTHNISRRTQWNDEAQDNDGTEDPSSEDLESTTLSNLDSVVRPEESASQTPDDRQTVISEGSVNFTNDLRRILNRKYHNHRPHFQRLRDQLLYSLQPQRRVLLLDELSNDTHANMRLLLKVNNLRFSEDTLRRDFLNHFHSFLLRIHNSLIEIPRVYPCGAIFRLLHNRELSYRIFYSKSSNPQLGLFVLYCLRSTFSFSSEIVRSNPFDFPQVRQRGYFDKELFCNCITMSYHELTVLKRDTPS